MASDLTTGRASAAQLVEESLATAERTNPTLRTFITLVGGGARSQALESDARRRADVTYGILDGIPYAVKDTFQTQGILTTAGSRVLRNWIPKHSARVILDLEAAGAILLGKTNLHEFAYGATGENSWSGTAMNPYDPTRLAGGSSSGSAVAVAAGIVPFALGTDTGGSVRVPAALCGVIGFKPTLRRFSLDGVVPFCWSLDHGGILGRAVDDVVIVAACLGVAHVDSIPSPDRPLTIGVVRGWRQKCEPAVQRGFDSALTALTREGAKFTEIELPDQAEARTVSLTIQLAEALTYHGPNLRRARESFGSDIRQGLVLGQFLSAESYIQCKRLVSRYRQMFESCYEIVDLLLTPACPITAPTLGSTSISVNGENIPVGNALTLFTSFFNLVGAPAVVLPSGVDERGLPTGIQLVGRPGADASVLKAALQFENASQWISPQ